ncbi:MAG: TIM-barrel domain-containing protein [Chloroflexota bacterium]
MIPSHLIPPFAPLPNPGAVVRVSNLRITVFTTRLLRIEYSPTDTFEDRPSQPFWYRSHPAPQFEVTHSEARLEIVTPDLHLSYAVGAPISAGSLAILVKETGKTWHYGDPDNANLGGTYRTLDMVDGQVPIEPGLLSRDGWAVVDDSHSLVFDAQGWLEPRGAPKGTLDLYFFGYGLAYQDCIRDYRALTGAVPLLPRWVLGNWWSRYWAYTQPEIIALIQEFQDNEVPLSVFIIDMDWHITATSNQSAGWTGYTWNRDLFPAPKMLIRHIHERSLKTALNLHPAAGIHPHEEQYPAFAEYMGVDPATGQPIPFDLADPKFTRAYFELLHHPQEADGVDFWWIDWQQGTLSSLPGLDPLWWLNHLHFYDLARPVDADSKAPAKRPFIFSRWGGLGNHRYPIGFSGDTVVSWDSLAFQPYFTSTAANVCYGWWSHDIGGHCRGIEDPELYLRWVQYGLFSPIFRLHSTANPFHERRPFAFDAEISRLACYAMQLRHAFVPYLYTLAWRDHSEGMAPIRPLYHIAPKCDPAYHYPNQYTFGSELIAAPHTTPIDPDTRLSRQHIWLPEGEYFDFFTGEYIPGGHHTIYGDLEDMPLFAEAGAIIPLAPRPTWGGIENPSHLRIHVFPGADNHFQLFEDDGETIAYRNGTYALTPFDMKWDDNQLTFTIGPAEGDLTQYPDPRTYELKFQGMASPDEVLLQINGKPLPCLPEYDSAAEVLTVPIDANLAPTDTVRLVARKESGSLLVRRGRILQTCQRLLEHFRLETDTKAEIAARLPEIIQNPALLARYRPTLAEAHLLALLETITRAGVQRIKHTGDDYITLWNDNPIQQDFPVTYYLAVNQMHRGYYADRYHQEEGPVPGFMSIHPPTQFGSNPWELRVNYGDVLTVRLSSEPEM